MSEHGKPHIIPLQTYFKVMATLLVLTAVTVIASRFDFGHWNTVIAMLIASVKASFVLAIFMHLKYDDKLYWVAFGSGVFFLFVLYVITWTDLVTRIPQHDIL